MNEREFGNQMDNCHENPLIIRVHGEVNAEPDKLGRLIFFLYVCRNCFTKYSTSFELVETLEIN